jgi:hypothetical protein
MWTNAGLWAHTNMSCIFLNVEHKQQVAINFNLLEECWNIYWHISFRFNMTNCLMPKLVWTQLTVRTLKTQITGAVAFQPQAGKWFFSTENCKFNFLSWPPTHSVNIIDFYVDRVTKSEKLTKNFVYLCHKESCWSNLVVMLIWFISCQLVKAERHVETVEFNWAAACCLEASNPAVASVIWNRNLMAGQ